MLMSKQSGAEMGEGDEGPPPPPQPKSYVEPDVIFFNRFIELVQATARVFSDNLLLSEEYMRKFSLLFDRAVALRTIVKEQLTDKPITKDEYKMLLDLAGDISSVVIPEGSGDIISDKFKEMALVADVHSDFVSGNVLEEGVGAPQRIYVAVKDNAGGARICVGYVYSYYEFSRPIAQRMTDEQWKSLIYPSINAGVPAMEPGWVASMRVR
jgi:hypothetical protein